ncbi:MAG: hypothetical protein ACT4P7_09135 [Gemmatimonadaceae bacterium]
MAEDPEIPARELNTEDVATVAAPPKKKGLLRRHWGKLTFLVLVGVPSVMVFVWSLVALSFSYSSGNRVGYVQKISRKGWLCKTWEGELQMSNIPGSAPILFAFSVRNDSVASEIEKTMGRRVELRYEEHRGVPTTCFGETAHFVIGVKDLGG